MIVDVYVLAGRLRDFVIEAIVSKTSPRICAHVKPALGLGETKRIPCKPETRGSIIKIRLNSTEPLQLCEVQVFGKPGK